MSFTFDTMQNAVAFLVGKIPEEQQTGQVHDVQRFLRAAIDALHDYSHEHDNELNRGRAGIAAGYIETALHHEDDEEREMWLRIKKQTRG